MEKIKKMLPFLSTNILAFYILPLVVRSNYFLVVTLMMLFPLLTLGESMMCANKCGFSILYAILVGAFFIPTVYIFYNSSALIYVLFYVIAAIIGSFIGSRRS